MTDLYLSSPKNPRVMAAVALRERRERLQTGLFLIEGARELERAINAGIVIKELYVCDECLSANAKILAEQIQPAAFYEVSESVYAKLAMREGSDGIVAVAVARSGSWDKLPRKKSGLVFVLEGVEKPGNLGAFLRSADGAGVDLVVVLDNSADLYNPHVIRASVGAVFTLPVIWADHQMALTQLKNANYTIYAASPFANQLYFAADLTTSVAVVLGSEADGLSNFWAQNNVQMLKLPMLGVGDSLNVATTGAILAYEARRQRLLLPE